MLILLRAGAADFGPLLVSEDSLLFAAPSWPFLSARGEGADLLAQLGQALLVRTALVGQALLGGGPPGGRRSNRRKSGGYAPVGS
jgi:hypothetical protein